GLHRLRHRLTAQIADAGAVANELLLLLGFDRSHPHGGLADIDELDPRQRLLELAAEVERDVIELDAQPLHAGQELAHRAKVVVAPPVGIGDVVAEGSPPGLPAIDPGRYGRRRILRDDHAVLTAEVAVEPA